MTCENFQDLKAGLGAATVLTVTPTFPFDNVDDIRVDIYNYNSERWVNVPKDTGLTANLGTGGTATDFYSWTISSVGVVTTQLATDSTTPKLPAGGTAKHPLVPNAGTDYPIEDGSRVNVRVYRKTSIAKGELPAHFYPGSAVKAEDLNENFESLRRVIEEGACSTNNINDGSAQLDARYWNKINQTLSGDTVLEAEAWPNNDTTIATTAAIDNRIDTKITEGTVGEGGKGIVIDGKKIINDIDTAAGLEYSNDTDAAKIQVNLGTNLSFNAGTGAIDAGDTSKWNLNNNDLSPKTPGTTNVAIGGTDNNAAIYLNSNGAAKLGNTSVGGTLGVTSNTTVGGTLGVTGAATAAKPAANNNSTQLATTSWVEMKNLQDVDNAISPVDGQVLVYDGSEWEAGEQVPNALRFKGTCRYYSRPYEGRWDGTNTNWVDDTAHEVIDGSPNGPWVGTEIKVGDFWLCTEPNKGVGATALTNAAQAANIVEWNDLTAQQKTDSGLTQAQFEADAIASNVNGRRGWTEIDGTGLGQNPALSNDTITMEYGDMVVAGRVFEIGGNLYRNYFRIGSVGGDGFAFWRRSEDTGNNLLHPENNGDWVVVGGNSKATAEIQLKADGTTEFSGTSDGGDNPLAIWRSQAVSTGSAAGDIKAKLNHFGTLYIGGNLAANPPASPNITLGANGYGRFIVNSDTANAGVIGGDANNAAGAAQGGLRYNASGQLVIYEGAASVGNERITLTASGNVIGTFGQFDRKVSGSSTTFVIEDSGTRSLQIFGNGDTHIGGTLSGNYASDTPNIKLSNNGSATFEGGVTSKTQFFANISNAKAPNPSNYRVYIQELESEEKVAFKADGSATFTGGNFTKNKANGSSVVIIGDTFLRVYDTPNNVDDYKISLNNDGSANFTSLQGTGIRNVVADANGKLAASTTTTVNSVEATIDEGAAVQHCADQSDLTLHCTAIGKNSDDVSMTGTIAYQWIETTSGADVPLQILRAEAVSGADTDTLLIEDFEIDPGNGSRKFKCTVTFTDPLGGTKTTTTAETTVTLAQAISIVTNPVDISLNNNETGTFAVTIAQANADLAPIVPTYVWKINGFPITTTKGPSDNANTGYEFDDWTTNTLSVKCVSDTATNYAIVCDVQGGNCSPNVATEQAALRGPGGGTTAPPASTDYNGIGSYIFVNWPDGYGTPIHWQNRVVGNTFYINNYGGLNGTYRLMGMGYNGATGRGSYGSTIGTWNYLLLRIS